MTGDALLAEHSFHVGTDGALLALHCDGDITNAPAFGQAGCHATFRRRHAEGLGQQFRIDARPAARFAHQHQGGDALGAVVHRTGKYRTNVQCQAGKITRAFNGHGRADSTHARGQQGACQALFETGVILGPAGPQEAYPVGQAITVPQEIERPVIGRNDPAASVQVDDPHPVVVEHVGGRRSQCLSASRTRTY